MADETAKRHALHLINVLGSKKRALAAVAIKIEDAPFMVGQDRSWWIAVREALR